MTFLGNLLKKNFCVRIEGISFPFIPSNYRNNAKISRYYNFDKKEIEVKKHFMVYVMSKNLISLHYLTRL